jgi:hypothetical protein
MDLDSMFSPFVEVRFHGQEKARKKVHQFRATTLEKLREAAQRRAKISRDRMRAEMAMAYSSRHATGRLGRSIGYRTELTENGVNVSFVIGAFRELSFVTALAGGHFQNYPVGPFIIEPNPPKKHLRIQFRSGEVIYPLRVLWGSESGGFERDVLAEVGQSEGESFVSDILAEFDKAIAELSME